MEGKQQVPISIMKNDSYVYLNWQPQRQRQSNTDVTSCTTDPFGVIHTITNENSSSSLPRSVMSHLPQNRQSTVPRSA
jgi:hypothetical protein